MEKNNLLEVKHLKKYFPIRGGLFKKIVGQVKAVDDVSFHVKTGETLGLVGESGCGKSTTGRAILRLLEPTAGCVEFAGADLMKLSREEMRRMRKNIQMIFQDPYASLNPRMTAAEIIGEALPVHGMKNSQDIRQRVKQTMDLCGLTVAQGERYPHEFSGGQRQRIGIARALALKPKLIIADEPVSALDVSIQAQIINLLQDLQVELGLTYVFISHDLSVIRHISTRVGVMYLGKMVEISAVEDLYKDPRHPYTKALLSAIPLADPLAKQERIILTGEVPSAANPPIGCGFSTRCPYVMDLCKETKPDFMQVGAAREVACHLCSQ